MSGDSPTAASAPGRVILFGDHALDYGKPAISLALDIRSKCSASLSSKFTVDGEDLDTKKHAYVRSSLLNGWTDMDKPLSITTGTDIPPELGLGGLAAGTVSCLGAISMLHDHIIYAIVARNAFLAHNEVESGCTPMDTSISTHGGCVLMNGGTSESEIWSIRNQGRAWHFHDVPVPDMDMVLGYSGTPSPALDMRNRIFRFQQRNSFARDIIADMSAVVDEGHAALLSSDLEALGKAMTRNHRLLANLGASNPMLEKLVSAASRHSYGAKLTGYGGGGCIIALARDAAKVMEAIETAGGKAYKVSISNDGIRPED